MEAKNTEAPSMLNQLATLAQKPSAADAAKQAEGLLETVVDSAHKDGIKTTEFWLTLLVVMFGMGVTGYEVYAGKLDLAGAVVWLSTIAGAAKYLHDRAAVKIAASATNGLLLALALAGALGVSGCTSEQIATAESDFHAASSVALGIVTAAAANPALLEEAKGAVALVAAKAAPKDVDAVGAALAHVNAGNLADAQALLAPIVAASAPKTAGP